MKTKDEVFDLVNSKYLPPFMNFNDNYLNLITLNNTIDDWTTSLSKDLDKEKNDAEEIINISEFLSKELSTNIKKFGVKNNFKKLYDFAKIPEYETTMRNMILIYLVTIFENYLEEVLNISYHLQPLCISENKSINYKELKKCKDIEEVIQLVINKEIKEIIKDGIDGIEKQLTDFKIDIKIFRRWDELKERFYRRNLVVHNKGIIDERYKKQTGYKGTGTKLEVKKEYLEESFKIFEVTAIQIMNAFHEKFEKE